MYGSNKQWAFRDLTGTNNTAAMPKIATKHPITPSIPIARGWITRLMTSVYNIYDRSHFEFISASNFISIHSPSIYKLSMIRFVHKVHFDVEFGQQIDFTLFLRDNLKKKPWHNNVFVRTVCKLFLFSCVFFFLLFIMCRKKNKKKQWQKTHKRSKIFRKVLKQ